METQRSEKTTKTQKTQLSSNNNDRTRIGRSGKSNARKEGSGFRKMSNLNQFKLISNLGDGAYSKVFKVKRIADG
jgi:hypothetical protein